MDHVPEDGRGGVKEEMVVHVNAGYSTDFPDQTIQSPHS